MAKTIVTAWVEMQTADDQLTPEEREQSVLTDLGAYAELNGCRLVVVRTNSFYEPLPEFPPEPPPAPPQDPIEFGTD